MKTSFSKLMPFLFALLISAAFMGGCAPAKPMDIMDKPVNASSREQVRAAIVTAAGELEWDYKDISSDTAELTLNNRNHLVVVHVKYSASSYSIIRQKAERTGGEGSINNRYVNNWMRYLDKRIRLYL